jgi:multiple antibiotic resistance protein
LDSKIKRIYSMETYSNLSFWQAVLSLFFIFNSLGMIPAFVSMLGRYSEEKQRKIIITELTIALIVLLAFAFFGSKILSSIRISKSSLGMGGGLLLIIISLSLIFPKIDPAISKQDAPKKEPFIIPLAIPGLAGPGTIGSIMIFSSEVGPFKASLAFFLAWVPSLIILLAASFIKRILGEKGLLAVEKLGGMLICLIGIEMFSSGVILVLKTNFPTL